MEKNPSLAKGYAKGMVPINFKNKWEEISSRLNALGPPQRNSDGWQKIWRDLKFKVKKKISVNKAECTATGGGRNKQLQLSALQEAIANLMQFEKQLNPVGIVCGVQTEEDTNGARTSNELEEHAEEIQIEEPDGSTFTTIEPAYVGECNDQWLVHEIMEKENASPPKEPTIPKKNRSQASTAAKKKSKYQNKSERDHLLQMHNDMEEKFFSEFSRTLTSIKNTLKDTKKIEEEKLKLMKRKNEREKELFKRDLEIKSIVLQIKKKKL